MTPASGWASYWSRGPAERSHSARHKALGQGTAPAAAPYTAPRQRLGPSQHLGHGSRMASPAGGNAQPGADSRVLPSHYAGGSRSKAVPGPRPLNAPHCLGERLGSAARQAPVRRQEGRCVAHASAASPPAILGRLPGRITGANRDTAAGEDAAQAR